MDSLYDRTTEDSIAELAKAGCHVDCSIYGYGKEAKFKIKITRGSALYGGAGLEVVVEGEGSEGAAALRGAVATAETFLATVPKRERPKLPEFEPVTPPSDPVVNDILAGRAPSLESIAAVARAADPTDARRAAAIASGAPQAGDRARELVDHEALS